MDWLSGASGLLSAAGGIVSAGLSASQANKQDLMLSKQKAENDSWFNKEYYQNALDRSENAQYLKELNDTAKKRTQESRARGAVLGATPEFALAEQQDINKSYADAMGKMAEEETVRKSNAYDKYKGYDNLYTDKQVERLKDKATALGTAADNSMKTLGEILKIGEVAGLFKD